MRKFKYILFPFVLCCIILMQQVELYAQTQTKTTTTQSVKKSTQKSTVTQKNNSKTSSKKSTKTKVQSNQKKEENINSLKNKQTEVKKELKKIDASLSETRLTTKQTIREIQKLNNDIKRRNAVIAKQNVEIKELGEKIEALDTEIKEMEIEYNNMKQKYVDLIYHAYLKNNSYSRLLFILSASSFQESYRRFNYLQQFAVLRRQQAEDIEVSKEELNLKKEELEKTKHLSEQLLQEREKEQTLLLVEKEEQNNLVVSLQKREKELKQELAAQQKIADQLNKKIQDIIAKEAREAEKRRKAKAEVKGGYAMTAEEKVVSGGFERNKGLLMWPVNGTITGKFGTQPHPVLKHITTNNKGIYITAPKSSDAVTVFEGEVTQCFSIPGSNNAVIVRHGNFLTVYANLTTIYVKVGDKLKRGQKVGKIYEDVEDRDKATLLFQVWKEKDLLNPELWLRKKK